ncbi:unnamed protein product [Polarella glacialis]|uniref:Uncharacterized protein n=1 Tax=Polarella glacialis TaxID=89957 RepID=A0A813IAM2_POLGL|nr:unnamed protein product [Polarella glacialis]
MQKVVGRYMQISQLRALTGDYVVQDLSEDLEDLDLEQQPPRQEEIPDPIADSEAQLFGSRPEMEPLLRRSLNMDLQAVYGDSAIQETPPQGAGLAVPTR